MSDARDPVSAPARGALAERMARDYLRLQGIEILDHNRRSDAGEIDVLAREGSVLVFVEVRLRSSRAWVSPAASIGADKRRRLRQCARGLLRGRDDLRWSNRTLRFDAVLLELRPDGLSLRHVRGIEV